MRVDIGGRTWNIDTGFIVCNDAHYSHFKRLLEELVVETQPTTKSSSVRHDPSGLEYSRRSANRFFAQRRNLFRPSFHRSWLDVLMWRRRGLQKVNVGEKRV